MSESLRWPNPDKDADGYVDDTYIIVESGHEEEWIADSFAPFLHPNDTLSSDVNGESFVLTYRGQDYPVPRSFTEHDIHTIISSIAEVINDDYLVFVDQRTVGTVSNLLFVAPRATLADRGPMPPHLSPFVIGFDYFTGDPAAGTAAAIPYVGHDKPEFPRGEPVHAAQIVAGRALLDAMLGAAVTGKVDETKIQAAAAALATVPKVSTELGDGSAKTLADGLDAIVRQAALDTRPQKKDAT